jgi:hypothetical protein
LLLSAPVCDDVAIAAELMAEGRASRTQRNPRWLPALKTSPLPRRLPTRYRLQYWLVHKKTHLAARGCTRLRAPGSLKS